VSYLGGESFFIRADMENKNFIVTADLLASKSQRFLNFSIDLLIIYSIEIGIGTTILLIGELANVYSLSNWVRSITSTEILFFGLILFVLYYILTEIYFSRTFAKYFTKTLVVMNDGSKPDGKAIFRRTLSRLIPLEFLTFLGTNSRGWHDVISNTYVVKKHEFIEKKELLES
jgi:uncharacterized RDD family membrane protein YckC